MDPGLAWPRRCAGSSPSEALPVIVATAAEDGALEARLMDEGADDYIRKLLDPARFTARVKAALRRTKA